MRDQLTLQDCLGDLRSLQPNPTRQDSLQHTRGRSRISTQKVPLLTICRTFLGWMILWESVAGSRWGSAGEVLRSQGSSGRMSFGALRRRWRLFASNARSGPLPLPPRRQRGRSHISTQKVSLLTICRTFLGWMILWESVAGSRWGSAGEVLRSQGSSGRMSFGALRRRWRLFASNARSGPLPLPPRRGDIAQQKEGVHFYTKRDTLHYLLSLPRADDFVGIGGWVAVGAPREWSCARREALGG